MLDWGGPAGLRLAAFVIVFTAMASWEWFRPFRGLRFPKPWRWSQNLGLLLVSVVTGRLLFAVPLFAFADICQQNRWGLFNNIEISESLSVLLSVLLMDAAIYWQHVVFHRVPVLWRLHRVHHADTDFDVSTGNRFHPIEIMISLGFKFALVFSIGVPVVAVTIFEIILNSMAMFNHSNVSLPHWLEKWLRLAIVTQDFHRIHHSVINGESNSNYGFNLSLWDYCFRTYQPNPRQGQKGMKIGLDLFRERKSARIDQMLLLPFLKERDQCED